MIGYVGIITYDSFHNSINFDSAIRREYIVWGIDMWQNARKYFGYYREVNSACLLPVFDQEGQLFCFAYEDSAADREIRMLRELQNISGGLQFSDVYPEYKGVKIYEFNELAYFFAQYLENQGVIVEVFGVMWRDIFSGNKCQMPNYECLSIYAEGVNGKESDWKENIIRSVSVEFECIDRIYESNISSGIIKDANGDFSWFVEQLRHENEIVIIGTGIFSLNVYDMLFSYGIDIFCFVMEDENEQKYRLLGKRVLSKKEAKRVLKRPVF